MTTLEDIKNIGSILGMHLKTIEQKEDELKKLKEKARKLETETLPEMLDEIGIKEIQLANGLRITLNEFYVAKIPVAKQEAAMEWLRENGHEGIIKDEITTRLNAGEDNLVSEVIEKIEALGLTADRKEAIHPSTLKAFVNAEMEAMPDTFPKDLFGVYNVRKVEFK